MAELTQGVRPWVGIPDAALTRMALLRGETGLRREWYESEGILMATLFVTGIAVLFVPFLMFISPILFLAGLYFAWRVLRRPRVR